jgi:hypothetical protein
MAFKKLETSKLGEKFKFEKEGDTLTGHYMGSEVIEINGEPATKHNFQTESGGLISPLGSADLNRKLADVPEGMLTRVRYLGKIQVRNNKLKKTYSMRSYEVEVDEDSVISVAPPTSAASEKSLG